MQNTCQTCLVLVLAATQLAVVSDDMRSPVAVGDALQEGGVVVYVFIGDAVAHLAAQESEVHDER